MDMEKCLSKIMEYIKVFSILVIKFRAASEIGTCSGKVYEFIRIFL